MRGPHWGQQHFIFENACFFVVIHNHSSLIDFYWNSPAGFPANQRQHTGDWVISRFLDILIFPLFDIRLFKFYSIFIAQRICLSGHQLVFRRGFLLLALAVILLGFIVAFVVYDLRNRNKELHSYIHKTYICHVLFEIRLGIGLSGFHCCLRVNQHSQVTN